MNEHEFDDDIERRINALIDGELSDAEAEALKLEAREHPALAARIVDAWRLQQTLDTLGTERAPRSLTRKLKAIPRRERPAYQRPFWLAAATAVPVAVLAVALWRPAATPPVEPASMPIADAASVQRDVELAFALVQDATQRANRHYRREIGETINEAIADPVERSLPFVPATADELTIEENAS